MKANPPKRALQFLHWFCREDCLEEIEGDLTEVFRKQSESSPRKAKWKFAWSVIRYFRPEFIKSFKNHYQPDSYDMYKSYFKIGWRNLLRNKGYSFINIGGLALGMSVAMLIGLWIYDEISFEKYHQNYDRIVQVMEHSTVGDGIVTGSTLPMPLSGELRNNYGSDFKHVASTFTYEQSIVYGDKALSKTGCYAEAEFAEILTLDMLEGVKSALDEPNNILLNESLAKAIFGDADPINKIINLNNLYSLRVAGIYRDIPQNTRFSNLNFIAPVNLLFQSGQNNDNWQSSSFKIYALLNFGINSEQISSKIRDILYEHSKNETRPALFLNPMQQWHLWEFKNGEKVAGHLQYIWFFGTIGLFILLLACINFMNLSTARSEKRSKEVGIRKAIGSQRRQLIGQFFSESFVVVIVSLVLSLLLVSLALPWFNEVAGKQIIIVWSNPVIWLLAFAFCAFTCLIAGSYPAIYLSSFSPVKVLKGTFQPGRFAIAPRKVLVVVQFTVSVSLIIGTIIVFQQIEFVKNRPIGYNRDRIVTIPYISSDIQSYHTFRNELLSSNTVTGVAASSSPTTDILSSADNLEWKGKDPNSQVVFGTILIDPDYGNVVEWKIKEGRNFSNQLLTDSTCFLFNESAIKQMGLNDPLGETVKWHGKNWEIIGVVSDMIMTSPFDPVAPTVFLMNTRDRSFNVINLKINATVSIPEALSKIEDIFKKFAPDSPFNYKFADQEYAFKFAAEERIGKLASVFSTLAILISCLGIFGLASFIAEQRTKEIGIRKVLGASVTGLWGMLSKDFVVLTIISCFIAIPVSYYFMDNWLQKYQYRTEIAWWIFLMTGTGALAITLLTVSFQAIKAALMNPVNSLKSE